MTCSDETGQTMPHASAQVYQFPVTINLDILNLLLLNAALETAEY
jgi:hypothetical protein